VPKDAPWGIYTERVLSVYPQEGIASVPEKFLRNYIKAKIVYATVNARFRKIDQNTKKVIHAVGKSLLKLESEEFMTYFPIRQIQSGGGTSTNMMVNEVMANLASQALGKKFGSWKINSHDHLNMSQSSNDTFPWVCKLTSSEQATSLIKELQKLIWVFKKKWSNRKSIKKVGRTHLQDAVIISLGDEMKGYARSLEKNKKYLEQSLQVIKELNFWWTATWSLQNITPALRKELTREFTKMYKTKFIHTKDFFEQNSSSADLAHLSQSLVLLANTMIKISWDLRLMSSWPLAGIGELILPTVQPGSSIMPGKVNPSVLEAVTMTSAKVIWIDHTIQVLSRQAQLELQQFMPGIAFPLFESLQWMKETITMMNLKCIKWMKPNKTRISELLEWSFSYATDYSEKLWYETVAKLVKKALKEKRNLRELLDAAM